MNSQYLPSDRWFFDDPADCWVGRAFWVTFERLRDGRRWVELLTWYGPEGRWGSPTDLDRLHFKTLAYQRADVPAPYFL